MQNNIVWSAKQRYPKYENVPDDELTLWYAKNNPEFLNEDAGFKSDYERITRERSPVATQLDSQPEAGVMESVVRRLGAGYAGVGAAGWKGVEYAQRAFGADEAAQNSKETSEFAEQFAEDQRAKSGKAGIAKYAGAVAEMVPGVLSTMVALPLGGPALIAAGGVYGGLSTLSPAEKGFYKQNIEAGMSEEEALSNARLKATGVGVASGVMTGLITRGFNRMGMGGLEATLARTQASAATAKAAAGGVLSAADDAAIALSRQAALAEAKAVVAQSMPRAFIQGAKHEALEEVTDQIGQAALEKMTFNPELTLEQAIESVKMAAIGGSVLGGGVSAMFQPTRVSQSKALIDAENLRASQEQRATEVAQDASTPFDAMSPKGQFDAGAPPVISHAAALAEATNNKNTELLATADANLVTANETAAAANAQVNIANEALAAAVALRTQIVPQTPAQATVATQAKFEAAMLAGDVTQPAVNLDADPKLPRNLAKANPRFGYGPLNFTLDFESDIERALYIVAGSKKDSAQHKAYLSWVMDKIGETNPEAAIAAANSVKAKIKKIVSKKTDESSPVLIPKLWPRKAAATAPAVAPIPFISTPAVPTAGTGAKGNVAAFDQEMFQGRGATPEAVYGAEAVSQGRAVPILGPGSYYAFSNNDAKVFGTVAKVKVQLKNPLVIDSTAKWFALVDAADAQHLNSSGRLFNTEPQGIAPATLRLKAYVQAQGYDGIIIRGTKLEQNKRLRESFGSDQVVSYAEMQPAASATINLESIAVKVADTDPKAGRLTAEESAILDRLTVEQKQAYLARVKELRNKPSEQAKTGELSQSIPATPTAETGAVKSVTADYFSDPQTFYRVVQGDKAFADIVETGIVRSVATSDLALDRPGKINLSGRPTAWPSFSKGEAKLSYSKEAPNYYIITTSGPLKTSQTGRHSPGRTFFPTDESGNFVNSLDGSKVDIYKHIGDGKHDLVYSRGKVVEPLPTTPTTAAATPAMQSVVDAKKTKEEKKAISELNKKINALKAQVKAANSAARKANGRAAKAANEASKARARWSKASPAPAAAPVVTAAPPVPPAPPAPPAATPPAPTPPVPPTGTNVFDAENLKDSPVTTFDKIKAALVARFAPLDALQSKLAEKISGYKIKFRLARMYEAVAGSRGKAEARFTELSEQINPLILGVEKQFSELVFFFAAGTRIANGIDTFNNGRKMTKSDVDSNIDKLRTDLIQSGNWAGVRQSLQIYKQSMDSMLDVMLESQLITEAEYNKLKVPNAFYAPFIKTEVGQRGGRGGTADGQGGYSPLASAKGQQDPDAKLRPALDAALEYYTKVHSRADINTANLYLYELAKQANAPELARVDDTALIREDAISVLVKGKLKQIVVHKDVAAAVAAIPRSVNALSNITTAMAALVRFGATTASIPFQFRNFFFSDMPNAAIVSEAGVRNPVDAINYIFAVWKAFKLAYAGNMGSGATPAGYLAAQKAGVLGGGLQASFEAVGGGRSGRKGDILNTIGDIGRVIEETTKLAVFQRLLDKAGVNNISQMTTEDAMNLIAEVRNYGGSPDFLRGGSLVKSANLTTLLIFVPATIQGNASTIGRMLDNVKSGATKHERDTARAALTRAGLFVGTATLAAYALNHLTKDYEDDFEKISASERRDYWMIPTDTLITSATGEKVRKYYRIQKRGITKMMASSIEDAMAYAKVTDQKHFNEMLAGASESILPFSVKGDTAEKKMMSAAASLNPLLKVFAEYMTGKDFYAGKQTVPRFMELASVDRQFGERTNENIKVMAGYLGMSPLKLRLALSGLTGGLSGKVLPDKPIEGDENGPANILGLVRSGYKEDADKELIEEARQSAADRSVDRRREAVKFVDQREGAKLSDIYQEAAKKYGRTQPDLVQKIKEILTGKSRGVTREDEVLIQLPPEERSGIIMTRLSRIPKDQQLDYVKGLYRKGVVTDATLVQLRRRGMPF